MRDFQLRNDTKLLLRNDPIEDLSKLSFEKIYYLSMEEVL